MTSPLHDSEKVVGRIRRDGGWDRRFRPVPKNPDASSIGELIAGILVLILLFGALFIGVPIIFEAWRGV